jgi:hypothetical protein
MASCDPARWPRSAEFRLSARLNAVLPHQPLHPLLVHKDNQSNKKPESVCNSGVRPILADILSLGSI